MPQAHRDRPATYEPGMVTPESDRKQTEDGVVEQPPAPTAREDEHREQDPREQGPTGAEAETEGRFEPLPPADGGEEDRVSEPVTDDQTTEPEGAKLDGDSDDQDPASEDSAPPPAQLEDFSKDVLQSMARERRLPTTGTKPELIERIRDHDEQSEG